MTTEKTGDQQLSPEQKGLVKQAGPLAIDVPRSIGYFGGIALAVAFEVIDWPVGLFIAAVPLVKLLRRPDLSLPARFAGEVFEGMAKPIGGDAEGTIQVRRTPEPVEKAVRAATRDDQRVSPGRTSRGQPSSSPQTTGRSRRSSR